MNDDLIDQISFVWTRADYSGTAQLLRPAVAEVLRELEARPPGHVVDVGAGHGYLAVELVERGWRVTAVEPTPNIREIGASTAPAATWMEGVAEHLPLPDASADVVVSTFALMLGDPAASVAEVGRVLEPGGRLVMTAWEPGGYLEEMTRRMSRVVPGLQDGPSMPWGDESVARARLAPLEADVHIRRATVPWRFAGVDDALDFYRTSSPAHAAAMSFAGERAPEMLEEIRQHLHEVADDEGQISMDVPYLVVTADRA